MLALTEARMTRRERVSIIYMPILIVVLTAIFGTGIGIWLQNRSFKKNELFKAKLGRIMSAQQDVVEILRTVDEARRQIRSNELFLKSELQNSDTPTEREAKLSYYNKQNPMSGSIAVLKESRLKINALGTYTSTLSTSSPVPGTIEKFTSELDQYLQCIDQNNEFEENCSDKHPGVVGSLQDVIASYSKMADELIKEYG